MIFSQKIENVRENNRHPKPDALQKNPTSRWGSIRHEQALITVLFGVCLYLLVNVKKKGNVRVHSLTDQTNLIQNK